MLRYFVVLLSFFYFELTVLLVLVLPNKSVIPQWKAMASLGLQGFNTSTVPLQNYYKLVVWGGEGPPSLQPNEAKQVQSVSLSCVFN